MVTCEISLELRNTPRQITQELGVRLCSLLSDEDIDPKTLLVSYYLPRCGKTFLKSLPSKDKEREKVGTTFTTQHSLVRTLTHALGKKRDECY